ncbi:C-X-C motif chemokine 13 [Suncus etruscus]|uniref:C-X-C motif chemokine 13 n=1 Tax=Suncus etruscus TaxID=109475 RepID=UPI00210FC98B|nr:C-X-C motif chemokine 13 [Suncus etruscus]
MRFTPGFLLLMLLVTNLPTVHGILESIYTNLKCQCMKISRSFIPSHEIKQVQIFPPGNGCPKEEIILVKKKGKPVCLNPQVKWIQRILKSLRK